MNSFYSRDELLQLGFMSIGDNILISKKASFYNVSNIVIGDNVRIDDFCILSGLITLGSHIHISAYAAIYGKQGVTLEDYTGLSPRATIYSSMDDFSGDFLIGPIHNENLTNVTGGEVKICKYSQIGANSIIFPNLTINEGCIVGAMSLVKSDLTSWTINAGIPAKKIKNRSKKLLELIY